jgi:hypothetical protein
MARHLRVTLCLLVDILLAVLPVLPLPVDQVRPRMALFPYPAPMVSQLMVRLVLLVLKVPPLLAVLDRLLPLLVLSKLRPFISQLRRL